MSGKGKGIAPKPIKTKKDFMSLSQKQFNALSDDDMIKYMLKFGLVTHDELMGRKRGGMIKRFKAYAKGGVVK